jgi:hypothetical protein
MGKVGFSIFGRPVKHEFKSNGLFTDLNIDEQTYLSLPGRGELKQGDNLTLVFRENIGNNEVIKIFSYDYAVSFNNRSGGFVGSGIVFNGIPTPKLLFSAYKAIHQEALKLLNAEKKFKEERPSFNAIDLINPATEGLVGNSINSKNINLKVGSSLGVRIDGPVQNHLMSVVQGFMFNPNFRTIEKLYVSSNQQLLVDCIGNDKIYGIQQLLDFSDHFKSQYESIGKLKKEREDLEDQIKSLQNDTNKINSTIRGLESQISEQQKKKNELDESSELIIEELEKGKREKEKLRKVLDDLKREKTNSFVNLLNSKQFHSDRIKYLEKFENSISQLENDNKKLKQQLEDTKERPFLNQKTSVFLGLFSVILLFGSGFIGYKLKGRRIVAEQEITTDGPGLAVNTDNESSSKAFISAPKEYTIKEFLSLSSEEITTHKNILDVFISGVESADPNETDLSNFFDRKWNFAEVIDYDPRSIDNGLRRLKRIKDIYSKHGKNIDFFEKHFMVEDFESYDLKPFEFSTSKRQDILAKYLNQPNNIYISNGISDVYSNNFEAEQPLLYMHFRWMVYVNSEYSDVNGKTKEADIVKTSKTKHIVPLK